MGHLRDHSHRYRSKSGTCEEDVSPLLVLGLLLLDAIYILSEHSHRAGSGTSF